ncbi:MAG: LysR family transcriptional regulator [Candidatus Eisenbacteria bacterium]|nr:LysR family transcriptional regulator [Candidatus Eisenbacteria bacterium]
MQLDYLETLVEAAASGSFSRAAERLFLTQSAVSKRIRFLEEHYGYPLLDRSGPLLVPTPAGRLVLEKAQHLLSIERELEEGLQGLHRRRAVSFCCTPAFGVAHLPEVMRHLVMQGADMSGVRFLFDTPDNILRGVTEERYDIAVAEHCTAPDLAGLTTFELPADEMVFVSSPSLGLPTPGIPLGVLCGQTLLHRQEACCSRIFLDANLARVARSLTDFRRTVLIDDLPLILQSAVEGAGVAFVSRDVASAHVRSGALVTHRVEGFVHRRERTLVASARHSSNAPARQLLESVLASFPARAKTVQPIGA